MCFLCALLTFLNHLWSRAPLFSVSFCPWCAAGTFLCGGDVLEKLSFWGGAEKPLQTGRLGDYGWYPAMMEPGDFFGKSVVFKDAG
jgi:hypothetical protein